MEPGSDRSTRSTALAVLSAAAPASGSISVPMDHLGALVAPTSGSVCSTALTGCIQMLSLSRSLMVNQPGAEALTHWFSSASAMAGGSW